MENIIIVSAVLVLSIVLLVSEKVPTDLTAIGIIVVLLLSRVVSPAEALVGFSNPAIITVAVLFIVSRGLVRTGALEFITASVMKFSKGNPGRLLFMSLFLVGSFSSFLNNTPVVVLFISIILAVCSEYSLSPSKFLMPISFVSILAGTSTLIGTSTNIIVSDLAVQNGMRPIAMFELSIVGVPLAMAGAVYLYFVSPRLLPAHKEPIGEVKKRDKTRYISDVIVPGSSLLIGKNAREIFKSKFPDIELFQVYRDFAILDPVRDGVTIQAGDEVLIKASARHLAQILESRAVVLPPGDEGGETRPHDNNYRILELLVQPNSSAIGQSLGRFMASLDAHITVLGVNRHWKHYPAGKVRNLRLGLGDILLVQTPLDHLEQIRSAEELIVIDDVHKTIVNKKKAPLAMGIFLLMIAAATFGIFDILVSALAATLLMIATGCISLREAYRSLDPKVLILIIGTIALGNALSVTGAADLYAELLLMPFAGMSPYIVLSAFILLTSMLSLFLSNNSTAVLLMPIALSTASALQVDPRAFLVGLCFGASACYATPIGYQTNLLVYGPGGYVFKDYLKLGIPLTVGVWIASSIFVPMLWPF